MTLDLVHVQCAQACDDNTTSSWVTQHLLQLPSPASSSGGGSTCWLDAGSCCLLACQCSILQRVGRRMLPGSSQPPLGEHLSQLWLTAQQVRSIDRTEIGPSLRVSEQPATLWEYLSQLWLTAQQLWGTKHDCTHFWGTSGASTELSAQVIYHTAGCRVSVAACAVLYHASQLQLL
jgi:hypothetical protein